MADKQPEALRYLLLNAAIDCPHSIDSDVIELYFDKTKPGVNALAQLGNRLDAIEAKALAEKDALIAELVEALEEVVKVINDDPPSIADTIWCSSGLPCTLLDCCLMALAKAKEAQ